MGQEGSDETSLDGGVGDRGSVSDSASCLIWCHAVCIFFFLFALFVCHVQALLEPSLLITVLKMWWNGPSFLSASVDVSIHTYYSNLSYSTRWRRNSITINKYVLHMATPLRRHNVLYRFPLNRLQRICQEAGSPICRMFQDSGIELFFF